MKLEDRIEVFHRLVTDSVPDPANQKRVMAEFNELMGRDPLTGLPNRLFLSQRFEEEIGRTQRYDHPLSVIFIDIDNFKEYNDKFGHLQGDIALKTVGQILTQNVRKGDIVIRYGGEEFCAILPETPLEGAVVRAENLVDRMGRTRIKEYVGPIDKSNVEYIKSKGYDQLTISVGVANFPSTTTEPIFLINDADQAMYTSKKTGRNKFSVFGNPTNPSG